LLHFRVTSIVSVAVLNGELKILVDPKTFHDSEELRKTLRIVKKYNRGCFSNLSENNIVKYNGQGMKGKKYARQGSKIIITRPDASTPKHGTLSCFAKMKKNTESENCIEKPANGDRKKIVVESMIGLRTKQSSAIQPLDTCGLGNNATTTYQFNYSLGLL